MPSWPPLRQFVGLLTRVAIVANGAVVLVSHPSLTGITSDSGISGTTQWHNAVRARFYMKGIKPEAGEQPDNDLREIVFKKNQYGPASASIIVRYQNGLFLPVPGMASLEKVARDARAEEIFLDLLQRLTSDNRRVSDRKSPTYAPAVFARESAALKAGITSNDLAAAMRRLFEAKKIWNEPYGKPSRPSFRLARRDQ
jgi:RecA-family ATPase